MDNRGNDVATGSRDAPVKLPSLSRKNSTDDGSAVQRSGSWQWPTFGSKGRDSTSLPASMDQDMIGADQSLDLDASGTAILSQYYSPPACMHIDMPWHQNGR